MTDESAARILATALSRTEFNQYTRHFSSPFGTSTTDDIYRFRSAKDIKGNSDLRVNPTADTVESYLINSTLCEPYFGKILCAYCTDYLQVTDITDVIDHIMQHHTDVLASAFTCPACLTPRSYNRHTYSAHFKTVHAPTYALLPVLNDISTGHRLQYGMALHTLLHILTATNFQLPCEPVPMIISNRYGGYGALDTTKLTAAVKQHQTENLPPQYVAAKADFQKARQTAERNSHNRRHSPDYSYSAAAASAGQYNAHKKSKQDTNDMDFETSEPQANSAANASAWRETRSPSPPFERVRSRRTRYTISPTPSTLRGMSVPSSSILDEDDDNDAAPSRSDDEL